MRPPKRNLKDVIRAIKGSGGIKTVIASRLDVERHTVDRYLDRWQSAKEAYKQETEINLDLSESVIITNIRTAAKIAQTGVIADSSDAWRYLRMKGKDRGYVERQEVTGENGDTIKINVRMTHDDD